ncbi:phage tail protein [Devosia ginsengisoli]|uniref:phage head spike fiber domain-containing protein n=1 Tax=Devosia ginsengisoli TaxID=400770 RepID=UPI0026EEF5E1|nr:phage tail protein [Devosia ginsengisoli]MCR6672202.1 phage tail protein [Devosia ginsengisoli]
MTSELLPTNSTPWERAVADAMAIPELVHDSIGAMRRVKYVSPRPAMLPFLVYEYGLGELTPYVPNLYDLIDQGVRWQRIRGTVSAVAIGLAWIGYSAEIEPAWTGRRWWNSFQLRFPDLPVADNPDLERIEGITGLSVPKRSQLRRGVHQYDVGPLEADHSMLDGSMLDHESGIAVTPAGTIWSFGRTHEFSHVLAEDEGRAIGNWMLQPGDISAEWNFLAGTAAVDGEPVDLATVLTVDRASAALAANAAGEWLEFAADETRLTDLGLTIEPAGTNYIRNNTFQGQVGTGLPTFWQVANNVGLTTEVLGTGVKNGLPYIRVRIYGTPSARQYLLAFDTPTGIPAETGQTWTLSIFAEVVDATHPPPDGYALRFREHAGATQLANVNSTIFPGAWGRHSFTRTLVPEGIVSVRTGLCLVCTIGVDVDVTIDIAAPQMELAEAAASPILTNLAVGTRAAETASLLLPAGRHDVSLTFDDDTVVEVGADEGGTFALPADLYRSVVKSAAAMVAGGGLVWAELDVLWVDLNVPWADDPAGQRRSVLAGWFTGKPIYIRLANEAGVIGYRRCRAVHPVAAHIDGAYVVDAEPYQPKAGAGELYLEALTQFDDADASLCTSLAILVNGDLAEGVAPGRLWLAPDEVTGGEVIAAKDVSIPLRRTVREQIKILMRF